MKTLFILLLVSINLFAWEVNTHRAIDKTALEHVDNLNAFTSSVELFESYANEEFEDYEMTYFEYIEGGELNGLSELGQEFDDKNFLDLLEAGSILEDAQWPHPDEAPWWIKDEWYDGLDQGHGRFLNHFYNVQGGCKSLKCEELAAGLVVQLGPQVGTLVYLLFSPDDAVEWAYDSSNKYDYTDAMSYFEKGFSESDNKMKEA